MQAGWNFEPYQPAMMNAAAPHGGLHIPKRQVHSNACQACRDRKSKCNNDRPVCRSCIQFNTPNKCTYDPDNDLRRKAGLRREVEKLRDIISKHGVILGALSEANPMQVEEIVGIIKDKTDVNEIVTAVKAKHIPVPGRPHSMEHPIFQDFAPIVAAPIVDNNGIAMSVAAVEAISMPLADLNDGGSITVVEEHGMMAMPSLEGNPRPNAVPVSVSHYQNGSMNVPVGNDTVVEESGNDATLHSLSRPVVRLGLDHFLDQQNAARLSQTTSNDVHPPYSSSNMFLFAPNHYSNSNSSQNGIATAWNHAASCDGTLSNPPNAVNPINLGLNYNFGECADPQPWTAGVDGYAATPDMLSSTVSGHYFNPGMGALAWNPPSNGNAMAFDPAGFYHHWDSNQRAPIPGMGQNWPAQPSRSGF